MTAVYPSFVTSRTRGNEPARRAGAVVAPGMPVAVALRPEKIRIAHAQPRWREPENGAAGVVTEIGYLGTLSLYKVRLDGGLVAQGRGDERGDAHGRRVAIGCERRACGCSAWAPRGRRACLMRPS